MPYYFDIMMRLIQSVHIYFMRWLTSSQTSIEIYIMISQNFSDQNLQRVKNRLVKYFGNKGLNIMFDEDKIEAIFLSNDFYFLYHKPPTNLNYMNVFSNHPKTITRSLEMFHVDFLG